MQEQTKKLTAQQIEDNSKVFKNIGYSLLDEDRVLISYKKQDSTWETRLYSSTEQAVAFIDGFKQKEKNTNYKLEVLTEDKETQLNKTCPKYVVWEFKYGGIHITTVDGMYLKDCHSTNEALMFLRGLSVGKHVLSNQKSNPMSVNILKTVTTPTDLFLVGSELFSSGQSHTYELLDDECTFVCEVNNRKVVCGCSEGTLSILTTEELKKPLEPSVLLKWIDWFRPHAPLIYLPNFTGDIAMACTLKDGSLFNDFDPKCKDNPILWQLFDKMEEEEGTVTILLPTAAKRQVVNTLEELTAILNK